MTTLSGSLQLLARRLGKVGADERLTLQVHRAREQVRRLEVLVGELTDVARLRAGIFSVDRCPVDLARVVRQTVEVAGDLGTGISVRLDIPDVPVHVLADGQRMQQVLLNLINNAFRHAIDTEHIDVRLRREAEMAVIEVRDYGPGISEEALANVFSPFCQATDEKLSGSGLGLGLFIAREIVSAHGGTIEMHSVDGEGVTVEVRLALLPEGETAAVPAKAAVPNDGQSAHNAP